MGGGDRGESKEGELNKNMRLGDGTQVYGGGENDNISDDLEYGGLMFVNRVTVKG